MRLRQAASFGLLLGLPAVAAACGGGDKGGGDASAAGTNSRAGSTKADFNAALDEAGS